MANDRINFYYDPAREGYSTSLFKTVTGVPSVASSKIRLNTATILGYADIFKGEVNYTVNVPNVPQATLTGGGSATSVVATWNAVTDGEFAITVDGASVSVTGLDFSGAGVTTMANVATVIQAGIRAATSDTTTTVVWSTDHFVITAVSAITVAAAVGGGAGTDISGAGATEFMDSDTGHGTVKAASDREFGLIQLSGGSKLTFKIYAGLLTCESLYNTVSSSTTVTWESAWTATDTVFSIKWTGFSAEFLINGISRAFLTDTSVPKVAMSQYFKNTTADNMDIAFININNVQGYI